MKLAQCIPVSDSIATSYLVFGEALFNNFLQFLAAQLLYITSVYNAALSVSELHFFFFFSSCCDILYL